MTAKEFIEKHYSRLDEYSKEDVVLMMKEYARQKCKEQRELCAKIRPSIPFHEINGWAFREEVQAAPEPKFD